MPPADNPQSPAGDSSFQKEPEIDAGEIGERAGTITNENLSWLGERLARLCVE
jgi:hypothetical protein